MARRLTCPECKGTIPVDEAAAVVECPDCGKRLRRKAEVGVAPAAGASPSAGRRADSGAGPRAKVGKRSKRAAGFPKPLLWGLIGGGVLTVCLVAGLLALILRGKGGGAGLLDGFGGGSGNLVVVDAAVPPLPPAPPLAGVDPAAFQTSASPRKPRVAWNAKPDPAAPPDLGAAVGTYLRGTPLFAARNGPFLVDLWYTGYSDYRPQAVPQKDGTVKMVVKPHPALVLVDLRTGKKAGEFPPEAPVAPESRLSADGRYVAGRDPRYNPDGSWANDREILVWQPGADKPTARVPMSEGLVWSGFVAGDRLAVVQKDKKMAYQVFDPATGAAAGSAPLDVDDFPPPKIVHGWMGRYRPGEVPGVVSPGGRYVALGGRRGILVLNAADGTLAGELLFPAEVAVEDYQGMSFREDGAELRAVVAQPLAANPNARTNHVLLWTTADGRLRRDVPLAEPKLFGTPVTGPTPDTLILPIRSEPGALKHSVSAVVDLETGRVALRQEASPVCWAGPDRLLAFAALEDLSGGKELLAAAKAAGDPVGPYSTGVAAVRFDRAAYQAKSDKAKADYLAANPNAPDRPKPTPADRTGVASAAPEPPAAWGVPPPAAAATFAPGTTLPDWPAALADAEAAVIALASKGEREKVWWVRYDLKTGRKAGAPVLLWPGTGRPIGARQAVSRVTVAALTADAKLLALRDPVDATRVDVWDASGKRLAGLRPYDTLPVEWLGWSADGRLLTRGEGKLTGWDVATGKAAFEVDGDYSGPAHLAPGRAWVVAPAAAGHADVLDANTGKCLGRCANTDPAPRWTWSLLSADGKTLLSGGPAQSAKPGVKPLPSSPARTWDLTTGKPGEVVTIAPHVVNQAVWAGPGRVMAADISLCTLFDLGLGAPVCTYGYQPKRMRQESRNGLPEYLASDPAGGVWVAVNDAAVEPTVAGVPPLPWRRVDVPNPRGDDAALLPGGSEVAFGPGTTVRVEVNVGDDAKSLAVARRAAAQLAGRGLTIGPGGWVLRAEHSFHETSQKLSNLTTGEPTTPFVAMDVTWRLLAPDGTEVWNGNDGIGWDPTHSKYRDRTPSAPFVPAGPNATIRITRVDFGGHNPRAAMTKELLEQYTGDRSPLPPSVLKVGGAYKTLPLTGTLDTGDAPVR